MIDFKSVFNGGLLKLDISEEVDLSDEVIGEKSIFTKPVKINGEIKNVSGIVILTYYINEQIDVNCDRCLNAFSYHINDKNTHVLVEKINDEDNDNYIEAKNALLDIRQVLISDIFLNFQGKFLCKEDCKGLCNNCGNNFNISNCDCKNDDIDPRLMALKKLL